MFRKLLLFNLILCPLVLTKRKHHAKDLEELGSDLIFSLRNDANLDLSMDEEYEDLRAELLAYHTALSSLTESKIDGEPEEQPPEVAAAVAAEPGNNVDTRRSLKTGSCWKIGGICVHNKMCEGRYFLSEIPGCKSDYEVCCFSWNEFNKRSLVDKGIQNLDLPWSNGVKFGGKGPIAFDIRNIHFNEENQPDSKEKASSKELLNKKMKKNPGTRTIDKIYNYKEKTRNQNPAVVLLVN